MAEMSTKPPRRRVLRAVLLGLVGLMIVAILGMVVWSQVGLYRAEPAPLAAVASNSAVRIADEAQGLVVSPASGPSTVGLLFYPGAKVEAEAYVSVMAGLAESGITVVIVKPWLNLALFDLRGATTFTRLAPSVTSWSVGGHSLGGVRACQLAGHDGLNRLVLFGSYCSNDVSKSSVAVLSIAASNDGLSTAAKIAAARPRLPAAAQFVVIEGANHGQFGAYGPQAGDGLATITAEVAHGQIDAAVIPFLT